MLLSKNKNKNKIFGSVMNDKMYVNKKNNKKTYKKIKRKRK